VFELDREERARCLSDGTDRCTDAQDEGEQDAPNQLFRLDVITIRPTPAMTAAAPKTGGMEKRSRS
jgi:hypothetical protein